MDKWNRKLGEFEDHKLAYETFRANPGGSIIRKPRAMDYQNTAWSPIHNGNGIRSRMYYEMGYSAEDIDHESVMQAEAELNGTADFANDPDAWMYQ